MRIKTTLLTAFLLFCFAINAQVIDDFSDGNFFANPTWEGDDSLWQVNTNYQLQSKGTIGSSKDISLSTQSSFQNNTEWRFFVRFNLSPSTQNFCRFYLASDQINLKGNLNGYYIQFGGSTGNTDSISLYKQEGAKRTRIIAGRPATVFKTNNVVDIKVNRDSLGNWNLYSDTAANENFILEGNVLDTTFKTSFYAGFFARFTTGNITNYFLDNVYIGEPIVDLSPPKIENFSITNDSTIQVNFSEKLDANEASNLNNFELDKTFPTIINTAIGSDGKSIVVNFQNAFISTNSYSLTIKNMKDFANNIMADSNINFLFYKPNIDDVVINELMPDPSPSKGLPDAEFIELFNRTNYPIDISNWKIYDLTGFALIPNYIIQPKEYLIITNPANESLFKSYGKTLAVPFLVGLNNDGDLAQLVNNKGEIINQIRYDLSWYQSAVKADGGWSLELINPFVLCKGIDNWLGTESPVGGTPGKLNFYNDLNPDITKPIVKNWFYKDDKNLVIVFNEKMDLNAMQNVKLSINVNSIASKKVSGVRNDSLFILLNNSLVDRQNYTIQIDSVFDCSMNKIADNTTINFNFIPIKPAQQNDIIITEISANPKPNMVLPDAEYMELFNRSRNIISLYNFKIKSGSTITSIGNIQLYPDSFLVICDDSKLPLFASINNVVSVPSFPTLSLDDEIILLNETSHIIHQIAYKQTWYNNNVKADGGWSLEMIDTKNPCGTASNWTASKNANGGTIGKQNSVKGMNEDKTKPLLTRIYPVNSNTLELYFSKTLDSLSACKQTNFTFSTIFNGQFEFDFKDDFLTTLRLKLSDSLKQNQVYTLKIDSLKDCVGNIINEENEIQFGLTKPADSNDLAINEILFNPRTDGVDFIEIYNKTNQFLDVRNLWIGNRNTDNLIDNFYPLADSGYMLLPNNYYILTTNSEIIKQQYFVQNNNNFIELNSLPSMNDDEGTLVIFSKPETIFDELKYDDKMHFELIDNKDGVSLERIDFNRKTNDRSNWTSAASTSNFATPTYKNSQYLKTNINEQVLNIEPEVFTPNNDGVNDLVNFTYQFNKNNFTANLNIYNSNGNLVKMLLNNAPLGTQGVISWNGLSDKNLLLPVGIYIVNFEYFNTDGTTDSIKKTIVIGKSY
ncbi:MAG: lamin tail domain-containing protein [Bacteroidia bacterium]